MNLPENLTLLNYVTCNGNTYIQTDIYVTNELGGEAKAARTLEFGSNTETFSRYIFSSRSLAYGNGKDNFYHMPHLNSDGYSIRAGFGPGVEIPIKEPYTLGTPYVSSINLYNSGEAVWNGEVLHVFDHTQFPSDKWCKLPTALLGFTNDVGVYGGYRWIGDFYYALFTLGDKTHRYFVPVLETSSGQAKIYEVIEGKVYEPVGSPFSSWG